MVRYGLTKEVIESGDLRIMLAVEPGTSNSKLFESVRKMDELLMVQQGQRPRLSYNIDAIGRYNALQRTLRELKPFMKDGQRVQGPCGLYTRGTCIIAGTATNLDTDLLKIAKDYGLPVIGLGNICYADVDIDYWIGHQDVLGYLPKPVETQKIQSFTQTRYKDDGIWDPHNKNQTRLTPESCVNSLCYSCENIDFSSWIKDPRGMTDGAFESTLTAGISLAVLMGFHNIVLTGIRLGGDVDDYFIFDEVPHKETIDRKTGTYRRLRADFNSIYRALSYYGIRLTGVGDMPLRIPILPVDYMTRALHSVLALTKRIDPKKIKVTMPADSKRRYLAMVSKNQQHIVTPPILLDNAKALIEKAPKTFDTEEVKKAMSDYEAAMKKPGGCTGCMKNKVGQPLYKAFDAGAMAQVPELVEAWKEVLPDHYILKANLMKGTMVSKMVFREDKSAEEQAWKDTQL